jgi:hypothetical protein
LTKSLTQINHILGPEIDPADKHGEDVMKHSTIMCGAVAFVAASALTGVAFAGACQTGMTWGYVTKSVNSVPVVVTGSIYVSCHSTVGGIDCNPSTGDSKCTKALPILCTYRDPTAFPQPLDVDTTPDSPYDNWSGEVVGTTKPVRPCKDLDGTLNGANGVNAYCRAEFGAGWSVAEFHDGSVGGGVGWGFNAHGGVGNAKKRFWVDINDQPNGPCWNDSK